MTKNILEKDRDNGFYSVIEGRKKKIEKATGFKVYDIGRKAYHELILEKFTYLQQHNSKEKYFMIERYRRKAISGVTIETRLKEGDVEYRQSY